MKYRVRPNIYDFVLFGILILQIYSTGFLINQISNYDALSLQPHFSSASYDSEFDPLFSAIPTKKLSTSSYVDGLIAYLPFDEGKGNIAFDKSITYINDAHIHNASWTEGIVGSALEFNDVSNYATILNPWSFNERAITICAWVYYYEYSERGFSNAIISQDSASIRVFQLSMLEGRIDWHRFGQMDDLEGFDKIETRRWYFISAGYSGAEHFLSIDGVEQARSNGTFNPNGGVNVDIGRLDWGDDAWRSSMAFKGKIDEIRIYKKYLSEGEILAIYQNVDQTENTLLDGDFDGINDEYEVKNGLNPSYDDSLEDPDGDGVSNFIEYREGTNPQDFWSVPIILSEFPFIYFSNVHILVIEISALCFILGATSGWLYKRRKIKKLVTKLHAPNYETAKKILNGNFEDYETFEKADKINISSQEEYIFMLEMKKD